MPPQRLVGVEVGLALAPDAAEYAALEHSLPGQFGPGLAQLPGAEVAQARGSPHLQHQGLAVGTALLGAIGHAFGEVADLALIQAHVLADGDRALQAQTHLVPGVAMAGRIVVGAFVGQHPDEVVGRAFLALEQHLVGHAALTMGGEVLAPGHARPVNDLHPLLPRHCATGRRFAPPRP